MSYFQYFSIHELSVCYYQMCFALLNRLFMSVCARRVIGRSRFCPRWCRGSLRWTTCWRTAQMAVPSPPCCTFTVPPSSAWEVQKPAKPSTLLSKKYYATLRGNSVRELLNQNQPYSLTHAVTVHSFIIIVHRAAVEIKGRTVQLFYGLVCIMVLESRFRYSSVFFGENYTVK